MLVYVVYAINKSTRDNLVTVLDASFTDKEVSDALDAQWPVGDVELLGECPGRNDSTKRSRRHALFCDIYDATYVVDPVGIGRMSKYSPEDLNVIAMNQRIRDLEKRGVTLDATLIMKTSHYDALEDDFNIVNWRLSSILLAYAPWSIPPKSHSNTRAFLPPLSSCVVLSDDQTCRNSICTS